MVDEIHEGFLRFLTTTLVDAVNDDYHVTMCRAALIMRRPSSVTEWARSVRVAERYLREKWSSWVGCPPKHSLFLHTVFSIAFTHACAEYFGGPPVKRLCRRQHDRWKSYYERHQTALDAVIRRSIQPQPATVSSDLTRAYSKSLS
jgi:hypothetical protein